MSRIIPRILPLGLLLAAGLSACSGPSITYQGPPELKIDSLYTYGAAGRDLKLEVQGNGFAGQISGTDFAKRVEAGVQGPLPRPATHPTLNPGPTAKDGYRLVLLFNPAATMTGQDLCNGRADQSQPVAGEVHLVGAFCVSGRAETEVTAWTPATGPQDVRFQDLLNQVMLTLFRPDPRENPHGCGQCS